LPRKPKGLLQKKKLYGFWHYIYVFFTTYELRKMWPAIWILM
jgi:hypothetical protein